MREAAGILCVVMGTLCVATVLVGLALYALLGERHRHRFRLGLVPAFTLSAVMWMLAGAALLR